MKRSVSFLSGLVFISSTLIVFLASGASLAKETSTAESPYGDRPEHIDVDNAYRPPMVYADEVDLKVVADRRLEGAFDIINDTDETVSDLGYRIEVYGDPLGEEGGNDPQVLFGRLQSGDAIALTAKERRNVSFAFDLPSLPKGAYVAQVQILQTGGRKLGWGRAPLVLTKGTADFVYAYEASIVLPEFAGREVHPLTGPNVDPGGALMLTAKVEHSMPAAKTAVPTIEWHEFDESRPVAHVESFDAVSVKPGELSLLTLPIKAPAKPGVYVGLLTLRDGRSVISTIGRYRIVVRGVSADLISARLASVATKKGETAFARIDYVGAADAETRIAGQLKVELRDAEGVAGSLSVPEIRLTDGVGRGTARIELTRDLASEPNLRVVIGDTAGNVLRDAVVPVSLSAEQIESAKSSSTLLLWASWYAQPYYLAFAFVALTVLLCLGFIIHAGVKYASGPSKAFQSVSAAFLVGVLLFMQSPFAMAFGGSNGLEVFSPITVGENENNAADRVAYQGYWGEIYNQPTVALFVNRPLHNGIYQCNTPVPFEYRIDFAACNNMPSGGRVLAHFDLSQQHQSSLLGSGANWIKVYDQAYGQPATCTTRACIHSYSQNTTLDLNAAGLPANAARTTLRVVVKHNPYLDGSIAFPDDSVVLSDFYFSRRVAQAFNLWLNFACAQPKADIHVTKTAVTPSVDRGNQASFAVTVRNNGPDAAHNVVVTDQVPSGLTLASSSDSRCGAQGSAIVCNFGTMSNGSQIPVTFTFQTAQSTACGSLANHVSAQTSTQDDNLSNNNASASIQVNCPVQYGCIDIVKEASDANGNVISPVPQFTFTLDGNQTAVTDSTGRVRINNVSPGSHAVTETVPNGWQQLLVTPANGVVTVTAGSQCANVLFRNRQIAAPTLDLTVTKSAPASVTRGNTLFYSIVVTNVGPATASNVVVTDPVPSGFIYMPGLSDSACGLTGGQVVCQLGSMSPGSRSLSLAFNIPEIQNCTQTSVQNTATVSTSSQETNAGNNQSSVTTQVNCPLPQTGCIDIVKEAYDPNGNVIPVVPQFTFTLDGNQSAVTDSTGRVRINNVSPGSHTVTETVPNGWQQLLVTPANGVVTVTAGSQCANVLFRNRQIAQQQNPDVSIVKTGPSSVTPGNNMTYTLTVSNTSAVAANNVSVVDHVPAGLIFVPSSSDSSCGLQSASIACNLGTLAAGSSRSVLLTFSVPATQPCTAIQNQASVSATNDSNASNNVSGTVTTAVNCQAQTGCIEITKTTLNAQGSILTPTPQFTFRLDGSQSTVNDSAGKARFNNVSVGTHTVSEVVPSGWTMTSMTPANGIVSVTASQNNASCAQVTVLNQQNSVQVNADMAIVKTGPSTAARGTNFTYQLNVTNNGSQTATNVVVTDTLPVELIYLPGNSDSRCVLNGNIVTCNLGTMANGQQTGVTIGVTTSSAGTSCSQTTVTNRAAVASSVPDSNQSNNSSQTSTTLTCPNVVTFCPNVSIDADDDEVDAGDEIDYEIRVRNNTNQSQTFDLTAFLDRDMEFVDANGGGDDDDDEVEWNDVFIGANDTKVLDLTVEVDGDLNDGDSVRLRVETDCDSDSEETDIRGERIALGEANLTIDKSVDRNEALPGDVLSYTLTVRNSGSAAIDGVMVEDVHASNRLTIFSAPGGQVVGNTIRWSIGRIEVGAARTLHYTASVSLDAQNGDMIANTATVTASGQRASDSEFVRVIRALPQTGSPVMPLAASVVLIAGSIGSTIFTKRYFF